MPTMSYSDIFFANRVRFSVLILFMLTHTGARISSTVIFSKTSIDQIVHQLCQSGLTSRLTTAQVGRSETTYPHVKIALSTRVAVGMKVELTESRRMGG